MLDGKITAKDARNKLELQQQYIEKHIEEETQQDGSYTSAHYADGHIKTSIYSLTTSVISFELGSASKARINDKLKDLKKAIK